MLKPLDKRFWPEQRSALILYGENKVCTLAKVGLLGEPAHEAIEEFRDYKLENKSPGKALQKLKTASKTFLPLVVESQLSVRGGFLPSIRPTRQTQQVVVLWQ